MMKQRKEEAVAVTRAAPPPPPPLPKFRAEESVTKREIAKFWRQKRIEEEDHLLAAIKSAARLRARNLTEKEYQSFQLSLKNDDEEEDETKEITMDKEVRVGIKDWWTKSKYAYLNQPALDSMDPPKKRTAATYVPNFLSYEPKALYPTAIGVF
ncbi:uncharacterized protein LOC130740593 [Lotus japonicus]|uniref:Uncharacterized protein n=1 Tax=Lotus japonicus TaxID=34305 RepID=I3SZ79_LOTJA|nr:uncharacterized protein LOC130740593 [Lotus japonicus]AFK45571.1 unknown [Lotus japonicus]